MERIKKSIKKRAAYLYIPALILSALFMFSLIYCISGYKKNMQFYTDSYYSISNASASLYEYRTAMETYCETKDSYYLMRAQYKYDTAREDFVTLYSSRYDYNTAVRYEIESSNSIYSDIDELMEQLDGAVTDEQALAIYDREIKGCISELEYNMSVILDEVRQMGNGQYQSFDTASTVVQVIAVVSFIGILVLLVCSIYFIHKKVVSPVCEIYEWTRLFKDGYCDMAELKYDTDDEISKLAESFNIVKGKLAVANKLKAQYDEAVEKLNTEEEHKKNFVQQLYAEKRDKELISTAARHDGLTGLYNRRTFDGIVEEFLSKKPSGAEGALYLIDMDNFKNVNDTLGHLAGDEALKLLAGSMRVVFTGAYLGRYGGDEFIAFVAGYKNESEMEDYAASLCDKMNVRFERDGKYVDLSVSIGVSTTTGISEYSELYMKADRALYYSKENGRNQYKLESTMD